MSRLEHVIQLATQLLDSGGAPIADASLPHGEFIYAYEQQRTTSKAMKVLSFNVSGSQVC
jgi:hypothetical protein